MFTHESMWSLIPEHILIKILLYLAPRNILIVGGCCKRWFSISRDNILWRKKFHHRYKINKNISLKPGAESWYNEYKRLTEKIPFFMTQKLEGHSNQVLHVSFSHNGQMFATCSKDGYIIIWNSQHPCTEKYSHNMKEYNWKYTQFSQFNQSDSLLLVSGVHFGPTHSTSGEIAVFTLERENSHFRCKVVNRPYDIFGTWFNDEYLISGDLNWLAHLVSTSVLCLNKANQEIHSEHRPVMKKLYEFYNRNASSIRTIMLANCTWLNNLNDPLKVSEKPSPSNYVNNENLQKTESSSPVISENKEFNSNFQQHINKKQEFSMIDPESKICLSDENQKNIQDENYDDLKNLIPKYLIFSTGSKTYTPHQIGIKRIRNINFPKKFEVNDTLADRIAAKKKAREEQNMNNRVEINWWDYDAVADKFEKVDKVIDLHGHIIGMALSPDHRYLYVNTRSWPKNYVISNPLEPPPIAQEIDIHIIDLMTLETVKNMLKKHKAYTSSTECFFIFLDISDDYVASGAEDRYAYLWDRHYEICLAKYSHDDVVNSVAFNPKDSNMLVTTSDDYTIKVWHSRENIKKLMPNTEFPLHAVELK